MNTQTAKKIMRDYLDSNAIPYTKLSAKTVGFSDLARTNCIFVKIRGWEPNPIAADVQRCAVSNGFRVEFIR
jgi:hypothetical protein